MAVVTLKGEGNIIFGQILHRVVQQYLEIIDSVTWVCSRELSLTKASVLYMCQKTPTPHKSLEKESPHPPPYPQQCFCHNYEQHSHVKMKAGRLYLTAVWNIKFKLKVLSDGCNCVTLQQRWSLISACDVETKVVFHRHRWPAGGGWRVRVPPEPGGCCGEVWPQVTHVDATACMIIFIIFSY